MNKTELAKLPPYFLVFDVESIGLHGEGFAVGWTVVTPGGTPYEGGYLACPPENAKGSASSRKWCAENLRPLVANKETPRGVRDGFWEVWQTWKTAGAVLVADCAWPVEARLLAECVDDAPEEREWTGPYPLYDFAPVLLAAGMDPLAITARLYAEQPAHHPMADARQSARVFVAALAKLRASISATPENL